MANYVLESHFRGDTSDVTGPRCQFRRYVVDIWLENSDAEQGRIALKLPTELLYYLGHVPVDGMELEVCTDTDERGGAYHDAAFFTTSKVDVKWRGISSGERRKIARLMFCFSRWGMRYEELAQHSCEEIIVPDGLAMAGSKAASISANRDLGVRAEEAVPSAWDDPNVVSAEREQELPSMDMGERLARFAILSDTHVGVRYQWADYEWLHGVYDHLARLHAESLLDFVLELGDNIDDGYRDTYQMDYAIYLDEVKRLTLCDPLHPIDGRREGTIAHYEMQGNHDTSMDTRFFRQKLWYSPNGKVAFISFFAEYGGYPAVNYKIAGNYDSYRSYGVLTDEMVEFVEKSIVEAKERGAEQMVLCSHFGIAQDLVAPILPETGLGKIDALCRKYGIRLLLNGHEHNPSYALRKYQNLYDYDAAMTRDGYAVMEIYEKGTQMTIYRTEDGSVARVDRILL